MTSSGSDKEDLGDIVRGDTVKSVQLGEDANVSETAKMHDEHVDTQKNRLVNF